MDDDDQHYNDLIKKLSIVNTSKLENVECIHFCKNCGQLGERKNYHSSDNLITVQEYNCEHCGDKDVEYKRDVGITNFGKSIQLEVKNENDLKRQVFKSKTSTVSIPQIDLELCHGSLGACYCTVQQLVYQIYTNLKVNNPFVHSKNENIKLIMEQNLRRLQDFYQGIEQFTLIIRDLVDSSFIASLNENDENLKITEFIRNDDDNEELGIDTMQTENY